MKPAALNGGDKDPDRDIFGTFNDNPILNLIV